MQLPPMTARPPSMRMLPRGQSLAHWPQATHASLTANFCALPAAIFGQTALSSWFSGFFGGAFFVRAPVRTSCAICRAFLSARRCAAAAGSGGSITLCGSSQMHEHWCETAVQ